MTNIISSLGAGSGIDTKSLVDQLIESERAPVVAQLDSRQTKLEANISGYGALRSAMTSIQDGLKLLADTDTFNGRNVNFPENNLLTPNSVDPEALTGEYSIKVTALATAHSLSTSAAALYTDPNAVVGNGTLSFSFGDWDGGSFTIDDSKGVQTLTIDDSNNSLNGIRDAINEADFGVQAAVVNTGSGYQLQITGPSGATNEMSIEVTEGSPAGLSALSYQEGSISMDENQVGADAEMIVNGLAITRSSNTVDDVVEGLNFTLNNTSLTETVAINITADKTYPEQVIRDFVQGYNDFLDATASLTGSATDEEDTSIGSLNRDASAKTMINQIRSSISQTITGLTGNYNALATIGVETDFRTGKLSIEEDLLSSALSDNFSKVADLFTSSTSSSDTRFDVIRTKETTAAGSFDVVVTVDPSKGGWAANNAIDTLALPTYQTGTDDFSSTLTADSTYTFQVTVDGTTSETLTLSGDFDTVEEIRAQLQSLINGDANLSAVNAKVDVEFDSATDRFSFQSREWGSDSKVNVVSSGAGMAALGIDASNGTSTAGVDVVGTINGESAFGSGNILLPDLNSDLGGLSVRIAPGAASAGSATITHSRGFSNELNNILNEFLATNGLLATREEGFNDGIEDIEEDRSALDTRMESRRAQLEAQYLAMERIIASLNATSDSLDGILDRLPFTAQNN